MKLFLLYIFFISASIPIFSQVSIGSIIEPKKGLILELKENTEQGVSIAYATKGLGLPRVSLEFIDVLTIDNPSEKLNYVGVVVYNIADNESLVPGTYVWNGEKWRLLIPVLGKGEAGQVVTSLGNGKSQWNNYVDYDFFKPSFIIEENLNAKKTYSFKEITAVPNDNSGATLLFPSENLFNSDLYKTQFKAKTNKLKLFNITIGVRLNFKTIDNRYMDNPIIVHMTHQVLMDNILVGTAEGGSSKSVFEVVIDPVLEYKVNFSILLPANSLSIGDHDLSFQVGITPKYYNANNVQQGGSSVYINSTAQNSKLSFDVNEEKFFTTEITYLTMVLYEK